jgi:hypothetical protein
MLILLLSIRLENETNKIIYRQKYSFGRITYRIER